MLDELAVENLGLIATAHLEPPLGFVVITGETGAGKTLLLGALRLLRGDTAAKGQIGPAGDETRVEARLARTDGEVVLARRVSKSRAGPTSMDRWSRQGLSKNKRADYWRSWANTIACSSPRAGPCSVSSMAHSIKPDGSAEMPTTEPGPISLRCEPSSRCSGATGTGSTASWIWLDSRSRRSMSPVSLRGKTRSR